MFQSWRLRIDGPASAIDPQLSYNRKRASQRKFVQVHVAPARRRKQINGHTRVELSDGILLEVVVWKLMDIGGSKFPVNDGPIAHRLTLRIFLSFGAERFPSGQREQTVNLPAYAFGGSNPPLSTSDLQEVLAPWVGGNSSVGRARAFQARGRGFESRFPLHNPYRATIREWDKIWAHVAQSVEHFLGKEEVTGSNPVVGLQNPGGRAWHADQAYPRLFAPGR